MLKTRQNWSLIDSLHSKWLFPSNGGKMEEKFIWNAMNQKDTWVTRSNEDLHPPQMGYNFPT
jgi:hypothetical protein